MEKDKLKRYLLIAAIVLTVIVISITYFFALYNKQSFSAGIGKIVAVLRPLIFGAVFAYIMKSTANFYEKYLYKLFLRSGKRTEKQVSKAVNGISVILTLLTWFGILALLLGIAIPQIIQSVTDFINMLIENVPIYAQKAIDWLEAFVDEQNLISLQFDDLVLEVENWVATNLTTEKLTELATAYLGSLVGIVSSLVSSIVDIVIGLVIAVFILLGRKVLARKSTMLLHCLFQKEKTVNVIVTEFKYADRMFSGFLEGKVLDSTIIGLLYYIFLEIMNVPYPALIAVICGVTNIIPIFGPFIGAIPSGLVILSADPIKVIPFIIFVFVIQFLDGYIIDPHIVGGNINISSFCVVFAVLLFGGLWGFVGLLVGVPTFAVIYDIFRKLSLYVLRKRGKQDIIDKYKLDFVEERKPKADKNTRKKGKAANKSASSSQKEAPAVVEAVAEEGSASSPEAASEPAQAE